MSTEDSDWADASKLSEARREYPLRKILNLTDLNKLGQLSRMTPVSYTHLTLPTKTHQCRSRWSPYH